eukprot:TRINITY_DN8836_c1_g1_i2.p2 TRINITY_DN8836_c1_g1~~TRINITY_DN8836_c1_g1_i2.p2  ORF type:complete len:213 (-),score=31.04 TRINITY_DN8836_c1_g1_i2:68-706(-)
MPKITVQTLAGKQYELQVSQSVQINTLQDQIQKLLKTENQNKLIFKGEILGEQNVKNLKFEQGDVILAFPVRKAPSSTTQKALLGVEHEEDDDDDELKFKFSQNTPIIFQKFIKFLQKQLNIPDWILVAVFGINKWVYICLILFVVGGPIAHRYDLGPIYVITWILMVIFMNLGKRKPGEMSAYSVFNEGFQELPGQFNAQQVDDQVRRGQM